MTQGLFESVSGMFTDGAPIESVSPDRRRLRSIAAHLRNLLNARQGSVGHLAGYGLPDPSDTYRDPVNGAEQLRQAIARCVERYEPRIRDVQVTCPHPAIAVGRLSFVLTGTVIGLGTVQFHTSFGGDSGAAAVTFRHASHHNHGVDDGDH